MNELDDNSTNLASAPVALPDEPSPAWRPILRAGGGDVPPREPRERDRRREKPFDWGAFTLGYVAGLVAMLVLDLAGGRAGHTHESG